jgi:imidazolonepropionase-like amidohydrolase
MRFLGSFLSLTLFAMSAIAQSEPVTVLRAARLFDGRSEQLISNAVVVISGKKIIAVGSNLEIPSSAKVIDLGDATLLPGFIDAHTHITGEASDNWYLDFYNDRMRGAPEQAHYAALYARRTLDAGFTTIRNVGASEYVDVGLRNAINAGIVVGPRILTAVHAIGATGGHGDGDPTPPGRVTQPGYLEGVCNGPAECRAAVRAQIKYGADVIKFMPSGGVLSLSDPVDAPELSQDEMNAIVEEAHNWGRKVAAHCHGDAAAKMAIRAGTDSIEHGAFLKNDTLQMMKDKGVWLVPTRMAFETVGAKADKLPPAIGEKARAALQSGREMFRNALRIGVKIAFGTDSGVSPHGQNAQEFALMTALGMSPVAALRTATSSAATLLGIDERVGSLEPGKLADIIAVPGNPLTDIHQTERVSFVMKEGVVTKAAAVR